MKYFYDWQAPWWVRIGNGQQRPCRFIFWVMVLPLITYHFCVRQLLEVRKMRGHEQRLAWFLHCFFWAVWFSCFLIQGRNLYANQHTTFLGSLKSAQGHIWHGKEPVKLFKRKRIALSVKAISIGKRSRDSYTNFSRPNAEQWKHTTFQMYQPLYIYIIYTYIRENLIYQSRS